MSDRHNHWEAAWSGADPEAKSWHQDDPKLSLALIESSEVGQSGGLIDVGGGASLLTRALLDKGYSDLTVLDISGAALALSRQRLGESSTKVAWIEADVTTFEL